MMKILDIKSNRRIRFIMFFVCMIASMLLCSCAAYADYDTSYMTDYFSRLQSFYGYFKIIGSAGCAVFIAYAGFQWICHSGDEQFISRSKKQCTAAVVALLVLWILPTAISAGKSLGEKYAWDPWMSSSYGTITITSGIASDSDTTDTVTLSSEAVVEETETESDSEPVTSGTSPWTSTQGRNGEAESDTESSTSSSVLITSGTSPWTSTQGHGSR